jgi:hypothetical protein
VYRTATCVLASSTHHLLRVPFWRTRIVPAAHANIYTHTSGKHYHTATKYEALPLRSERAGAAPSGHRVPHLHLGRAPVVVAAARRVGRARVGGPLVAVPAVAERAAVVPEGQVADAHAPPPGPTPRVAVLVGGIRPGRAVGGRRPRAQPEEEVARRLGSPAPGAAAPAGLGVAPEGVPAGAGACESGFRATYGLRTALPCTPVSPTLSTICRPGSRRNTLQADLRPCRSASLPAGRWRP